MLPLEVSASDVKKRLDAGESLHLIDCREPAEHATASIAGAELIPMNTTPQRLQHIEDLADEKPVIVFCHHGMRSLMVVNWLREKGVANCASMSGGIDRWSMEIDPSVPRY
jgi:rhodanese-related sulfurtransferase